MPSGRSSTRSRVFPRTCASSRWSGGRFISVGAVLGYFLPAKIGLDAFTGSTETVWLAVSPRRSRARTPRASSRMKLAHLWLGHDVSAPGPKWNETEEQACSLVRAWGFSRQGVGRRCSAYAGSTRRSRTLVHACYPIAERADKARSQAQADVREPGRPVCYPSLSAWSRAWSGVSTTTGAGSRA